MLVTQTPIGLILLGDGTDQPEWAREQGGLVIGGAINRFVYVTHHTRLGFHYPLWDTMADVISPVETNRAYQVGRLNAESYLAGKRKLAHELATEAIRSNSQYPSLTVLSAHGGIQSLSYDRSGEIGLGPFLPRFAELEAHLLLCWLKDDPVVKTPTPDDRRSLFTMMRLAERGAEAIDNRRWEAFGRTLDIAWQNLGSTPELSRIYSVARLSGAFGGRLSGSFLVLVVPPEKRSTVVAALEAEGLTELPFRFVSQGSRLVYTDQECRYGR